ncbi:MAG: polymerase [Firmicutes bacterium]|nr:polymerase [Bacillota bacterium]
MAREIYADYTNQIEAFGIDENWLDVTGAEHISGDGEKIADTIRQRVKSELGVTVSVGVSWNKTFAKLGSDMKKPDAITVISENNFKQKVWPLPVGDLLYVGRATKQKFANRAIFTIGDLAKRNVRDLKLLLGVWGETLWQFANGFDNAPIRQLGEESIVKSVGNSTTTVRDLVNIEDVKLIIYVLAESVAVRLRSHGLKCTTVAISVRNNELISFERQGKISTPTFVSGDIAAKAMELFKANYTWDKPIRSLGVRGADLVTADRHIQLNLFKCDQSDRESLERTIDSLRERFGSYCIQRCAMMIDSNLTGFNPKNDHVIHPVAFTR